MSVCKWRLGIFNEFTLNSHLCFRMRKKREIFFITSSSSAASWTRSHFVSLWNSKIWTLNPAHIIFYHTSLSWGQCGKIFLRTSAPFTKREQSLLLENRLKVFDSFVFYWKVFFCCCFVTVGNQLPSQGAPRKNAMTGTFIPVVNNSSEVFWRCLAELWQWIGMKKNSTEGENNPPAMAALWKGPSACRFTWITPGWLCQWQGNKCTNPFENK